MAMPEGEPRTMPEFEELQISAIAFKEGDAWVVQGIEYDIVAHTYDVSKLPYAFARAVLENIIIAEHLGRSALDGIKAAPAHFREMYDLAETEMRPTRVIDRVPNVSIRLAA
jgi:hypothetical protein